MVVLLSIATIGINSVPSLYKNTLYTIPLIASCPEIANGTKLNRKTATGGYRDVAHPTNQECRKMFTDVILEEFEKTPYAEEEE